MGTVIKLAVTVLILVFILAMIAVVVVGGASSWSLWMKSKKERISTMTNCPNCGAPLTGHKCEYCGAIIFDFASIEIGKPV